MDMFCELLPIINTFHVYVQTKNIKNVEITENSIKLRGDNLKMFTFQFHSGIRLKKNSESDLQHEENWLCFRTQLEQKTKVVSSVLLDIIREIPNLIINSSHISDKVNIPLQLQCQCGYLISKFKNYKKICSLPIADWDHVSEDWFCHLDGNQKDVMKRKGISPQEDEIYYNELFFCVNVNNISIENVENALRCKGCLSEIGLRKGDMLKFWASDVKWVDVNNISIENVENALRCKGCLSEIGLLKGDMLKFWASDVKWVDEEKIIYEKTSMEILYSLLQILEKESLGSSPRLVLESVSSKKELLYIMVMDNHLNIFVNDDSPLINCPIQENVLLKKKRLNEADCYSMKKLKCVKVLYKHKTELDDESGLWNDDVNINVIQCGGSFFKSVISSLDNSNFCIPDHIRTVKDLKIGYILK